MLHEYIKNLQKEIENFKLTNAFDPINPNADSINSKLDPITTKLYEGIKRDGSRNYAQFAESLGVSEATVKRRLNEMKKKGLIRREGSNKTGYWVALPKR